MALLLWPGTPVYVLYTYAMYLIGAPFSPLFLVYVVLVALSAYTTIGLVASIDGVQVRERLRRMARISRQAWSGVGDLHTLHEKPQCQPDFSDEAHGEPGVADRGVGRQQQGLKEPDQDTDTVKHQQDAQEPGKDPDL